MAKTIYCLAEQALQFDLQTDLFGGGERVFADMISLLKQSGYEVRCYQFSFEEKTTKFRGHKITGLGNISKPSKTGDYENGIRKFVEEAEKAKADGIYYLTMNLAQVSSKIPSIVVSHGCFWNSYTKEDYIKPIDYLDLMKRAMRNCTKMISCDTDTCHQIAVWCPQYVDKLKYICNYVDLNMFKPIQTKNDSIKRIIIPRRIDVARGFLWMEKVVDKIQEKRNDIEWYFVGKGNEAETRQFTDWRKKHGEKAKHLIKDHREMPVAYQGMDLGIVPTLKAEGTSLALLELYASNILPITTWVGGLSDISQHNHTALVVHPNDTDEMIYAIEYALDENNKEHIENMKENGQRFIKNLSKDKWDEQIKKVVLSVYGEPDD